MPTDGLSANLAVDRLRAYGRLLGQYAGGQVEGKVLAAEGIAGGAYVATLFVDIYAPWGVLTGADMPKNGTPTAKL